MAQLAGRGVRALLAGDWRVTGGVLKSARRGVLVTRTRNVSEYMVVLALCLVNNGDDDDAGYIC